MAEKTAAATRDPRPYALAYEGCSYGYAFRAWRNTPANIADKRKQCPGMVKYIPVHNELGKVLLDCIGMLCAAYSVPATDGRPMGYSDTGMMYYPTKDGKTGNAFMDNINAETARKTWGSKPISSIPEPTAENPGVIVFTDPSSSGIGHIGIYLGTDYKNPVTGKTYKGKCAVEATTSGTGRVQVFRMGARGGSGSRQWKYWAYPPKSWAEWAEKYWAAQSVPAAEKPATGPQEAQNALSLSDLRVKPGDKVRIKPGSVTYWPSGRKIPTAAWFWKNPVFTVEKISLDGKNPRYFGGAPCVLLGELNTWCDIANLEKT